MQHGSPSAPTPGNRARWRAPCTIAERGCGRSQAPLSECAWQALFVAHTPVHSAARIPVHVAFLGNHGIGPGAGVWAGCRNVAYALGHMRMCHAEPSPPLQHACTMPEIIE
eukprot:287111-Chlamydomonas_euryale.AAC.2